MSYSEVRSQAKSARGSAAMVYAMVTYCAHEVHECVANVDVPNKDGLWRRQAF